MNFVFPQINNVFETSSEIINTIIIENPNLLIALLEDIILQLDGNEGKSVLSESGKTLPISKNLELLQNFVPFELNKKQLINKLVASLEREAVGEDQYKKTVELLSEIEKYMIDISFGINADIDFKSIDIMPLIKAVSPSFREEYDNLGEKLIDYFELVTEFDRKKLFITINLRSYISDDDMQKLIDTVLSHEYNVIMIESSEHRLLDKEKRYIIDSSLCEIC